MTEADKAQERPALRAAFKARGSPAPPGHRGHRIGEPAQWLQAIGGVNEKIEGFHRTCRLSKLTGRQGVIIPEANVQHLMLSHDVIESVRTGRFHVWSATDVDRGIELLTGMGAGRRGKDGAFPKGTVHARFEGRLKRWSEAARARAESGD